MAYAASTEENSIYSIERVCKCEKSAQRVLFAQFLWITALVNSATDRAAKLSLQLNLPRGQERLTLKNAMRKRGLVYAMRRQTLLLGLVFIAAAGMARAALSDDLSVADTGRGAFTQPLPFIAGDALERYLAGGAIFSVPFVAGRSEDESRFSGLGPLSHNVSCIACHIGHGRGQPSASENDIMQST